MGRPTHAWVDVSPYPGVDKRKIRTEGSTIRWLVQGAPELVPLTVYYRRLIASGDLVMVAPPEDES